MIEEKRKQSSLYQSPCIEIVGGFLRFKWLSSKFGYEEKKILILYLAWLALVSDS